MKKILVQMVAYTVAELEVSDERYAEILNDGGYITLDDDLCDEAIVQVEYDAASWEVDDAPIELA